jgi:hypothetical protein
MRHPIRVLSPSSAREIVISNAGPETCLKTMRSGLDTSTKTLSFG